MILCLVMAETMEKSPFNSYTACKSQPWQESVCTAFLKALITNREVENWSNCSCVSVSGGKNQEKHHRSRCREQQGNWDTGRHTFTAQLREKLRERESASKQMHFWTKCWLSRGLKLWAKELSPDVWFFLHSGKQGYTNRTVSTKYLISFISCSPL